MHRCLRAALAALAISAGLEAQAATYHFRSPVYESVSNFTDCSTGVCTPLSYGQRVTGTITTSAPLPVGPAGTGAFERVTGWSFSNGTTTISSTHAGARVRAFFTEVNEDGEIIAAYINVARWADDGPDGHAPHDRDEKIVASSGRYHEEIGGSYSRVLLNRNCLEVGTASLGTQDACMDWSDAKDFAMSAAWYGPGGTWTKALEPSPGPGGGVQAVPTLSEWSLLALCVSFIGMAAVWLRRPTHTTERATP